MADFTTKQDFCMEKGMKPKFIASQGVSSFTHKNMFYIK